MLPSPILTIAAFASEIDAHIFGIAKKFLLFAKQCQINAVENEDCGSFLAGSRRIKACKSWIGVAGVPDRVCVLVPNVFASFDRAVELAVCSAKGMLGIERA